MNDDSTPHCDSQTTLNLPDQESLPPQLPSATFPFRICPSLCEGLPAVVLMIRRASIMFRLFSYQQFSIQPGMCQHKCCAIFRKYLQFRHICGIIAPLKRKD